jgi:N-acetylneuraminate synthase
MTWPESAEKDHVFIIAEAGVNHNGECERAFELVDAAADAGADAVKFQTFKAKDLVTLDAARAAYQKNAEPGSSESQLEMLSRLELSHECFVKLKEHCERRGVMFLSTPFDKKSLKFLVGQVKVPILKMPSGEITNGPLLLDAARSGLPIILSTGMSTMEEVESALAVLAFGYLMPQGNPKTSAEILEIANLEKAQQPLREKVTLLHCTSEYPADSSDINLRAMESLHTSFGLNTGLSDHSKGITVAIAASALGAKVIEKHFTLDRDLPGPDHQASLEPNQLKEMVAAIRTIQQALGCGEKCPVFSEMGNIPMVRKSIVATCEIKKGEAFTESNLSTKRPGTGMSPMSYWDLVGLQASQNYSKDDRIEETLEHTT